MAEGNGGEGVGDPLADREFAHMFYFELTDSSTELVQKFIDACFDYLSGYEGQTHFSLGRRALDIRRSVSAVNFTIAVNMIFENRAAYERYSLDDRHQRFITEVAGMSTGRIVYDSYLEPVR